MLSFWEKNSFLKYDVIIIGSGILGLSTACEIKENHPDKSILILERGIFPTGASTKNAGFACFGSLTEILADFKTKGEQKTLELIEKRIKGIEALRKRLGDERIGYINNGGYELIDKNNLDQLHFRGGVNLMLKDIVGEDVFEVRDDLISQFGFNSNRVKSLVYSKYESQIDTGLMMSNLILYAQEMGIRIINGSEVKDFHIKNNKVEVSLLHTVLKENVVFECEKLVLCCNAFTDKLFKDIKVSPGRGQVLATKPLKNLKFKGVFHYDEGFYYFRDYENRVIFGGGRNRDFKKETSHEFDYNFEILDDLREKLEHVILPSEEFEIDYYWTGIMGFTETKEPEIRDIENKVIGAISCNGMGIALSSYLAKEITNKYFS
jgi:gamma-glutamylputrescine oxidase